MASLSSLDGRHIEQWAASLMAVVANGGRLLVAGNGGSAAEAQHLTAELVGRFQKEKQPLAALALHTDTSTVTALGNDYGFDTIFARQVTAHGRPGDILLILSTSGASRNLLMAIAAAKEAGVTTWALTGPAPNPVTQAVDDFIAVPAESSANVQECHLVAIHLLSAAVEQTIARSAPTASTFGSDKDTSVKPSPRTVRLTVIGDVLLDEDIVGIADRLSPEAPVAVIGNLVTNRRPGGAGLAAILAAQEGHEVSLITAFDSGPAARVLEEQFAAHQISVVNLGGGGQPATKSRIRAQGQTLLMLDGAAKASPPGPWTQTAAEVIGKAEAILVADYGRGIAAAADIRAAIGEAVGRTPIVWDPHPLGPPPVSGVNVVTPNAREARHLATGMGSKYNSDIACAQRLVDMWTVGHVAVTRGTAGVVLISKEMFTPLIIPVPFEAHGDTLGAGDKLAGVLAASLGIGLGVPDAVRYAVSAAANHAAGRSGLGGLDPLPQVGHVQVIARAREQGGQVVATAGCFDLLHRGHVALLQQARGLGDCLIVCLNSDASVRRLKGEPRPLVTAEDRAGVLQALACVDAVVIFDEDTPAEVLSEIAPDIYVKGGDYDLPELLERVTAEAAGGRVVLVPYLDGRSTTSLIQRAQLTG